MDRSAAGSVHDAVLHGQCYGLGTRCDAELAENVADMKIGSRRTDDEALGNRTIAEALLHQGEHFAFARAEIVAGRGWSRRALNERLGGFRGKGRFA